MNSNRPSETPVATELLSEVLWQREGETSLEHFRLSRLPGSFVLQGLILSRGENSPRQVHYVCQCDLGWHTQGVHVTIIEGAHVRRLQLERDAAGAWRRDGERLPGFEDLTDVDLQISPSTNTLPIRRLSPGIGEAADTSALWVRFPDLGLDRLPQRYTRLTEDRYLYESRGGAFRAELEVDPQGVVLRYGKVWRRV